MKRNILSVGLAIITLTSCYKDYIIDSDTQAVGFANQTDVRSVIVGEGMKFSTAVALAGVIKNGEDRKVDYSVDNSLVNEETLAAMKVNSLSYITSLVKPLSSLKVLPSSEYSLINEGGETGSTIIRKGTHSGKITVKIDSAAFLGGSAGHQCEASLRQAAGGGGKARLQTCGRHCRHHALRLQACVR